MSHDILCQPVTRWVWVKQAAGPGKVLSPCIPHGAFVH